MLESGFGRSGDAIVATAANTRKMSDSETELARTPFQVIVKTPMIMNWRARRPKSPRDNEIVAKSNELKSTKNWISVICVGSSYRA